MLYIALGLVLLGGFVGFAGMRGAGRMARRAWRPGSSVLALVCYVGAAICLVREAFAPAALLLLLGVGLSFGVPRARSGMRPPPQQLGPQPDVVQAAAILGVAPDASDEVVKAAYLRLIRRTHPDQGGTVGLAAQLNAARDVMLKR